MRKLFLLFILLVIGALVYFVVFRKKDDPKPSAPKQQPVAVSKYSEQFNLSVNAALLDYYSLSEAFVNWDTAGIRTHASSLQSKMKSFDFNELKKDTAIYETAITYPEGFQSDLATILSEKDITLQRRSFNAFSQNLFDLLRMIRYDASKVFIQECPMAFNDTEPGIWLSRTSNIRNPYLGLHHPKYQSGMLECGETKDSLRFANASR